MNPGSNLDSLPIPDTSDKLVVHAYAAHIGELLYFAINIVPHLSYSMSCLTRYMSKATPAHLTYARVVLRCIIEIQIVKVASLLQLGAADVYLFQSSRVLGEILLMSIQDFLMTRISGATPWNLSLCQQHYVFLACDSVSNCGAQHY